MRDAHDQGVPDTSPILNIVGEKVALGPATREQLPAYARWFSDVETMRSQGSPEPGPRTVEEIDKWYDAEMSGNPARAWFSVYELGALGELGAPGGLRHIGFVELDDIDHRNRTATMSLMIGEPDARGQGYGTEMARLILDYGFTALGLHNIALEVYAFNEAGQHAYRKAGFTEFARRSQAYYADGQWWDIIMMEALSTEFESPLLATVFAPDEER
jgi:RimJ/RimL family protein N-acetyltransferase